MSVRENRIQKKILDWINSQPDCIAENVSGNASQSGRSDINACILGRCLKMEVKRNDSYYDTTTKQELYLKRWRRAGAIAVSVQSLKEAKEVVEHILDGQRGKLE